MSVFPLLFIEDDFLCRLDTCEFLREHGFLVTESSCAEEAFAAINRHAPLEALVTDIELGSGANGFEIARYARSFYPRLPVVFISGTAIKRHRAEGVEGSAFIPKPFHPQEIMEALDRAIYLEAA